MLQLRQRSNLRKQITNLLFEAIVRGELRPGERIPEVKMARQLAVGQSTLREALQELEHRGLISKRDNRGTFVTKLTVKEVESIYAVRLQLEPMAAALACQRLKADDSIRLGKLLDQMKKASQEHNFTELMKSDLAFHQEIWKLSDSSALERALNLICPPLFAFYQIRLPSNSASYDFAQDHAEHCEWLAALNRRNPVEVRMTIRETLEIFRKRHIDHVKVDWDEGKSTESF